jgi:NAD+ kinase
MKVFFWQKKSFLEIVKEKGQGIGALENRELAFFEKVVKSHEETSASREKVRKILEKAKVEVIAPKVLRRIPDDYCDLVVVLGGDGTVLDVARRVGSTPVLAINSSPSTSVGHFCYTDASGFEEALQRVFNEEPKELTRIRVVTKSGPYPYPALNDCLFAHRLPAATSRYIVKVGEEEEEQKSSGVWVSTSAGATGAIMSAGGEMMSLDDKRLQFIVREPFLQATPNSKPYKLLHGFLGKDGIVFTSRMMEGRVYLDGRRTAIPIRYGESISLLPDAPPLRIYLKEKERR